MQAQLIPHEYVNKDSSCIFFRSLFRITVLFLCSCAFSSTTFCTVEKTLFVVPFFRGTLGYSAARKQEASLKAVQYLLTLASRITSLGLL